MRAYAFEQNGSYLISFWQFPTDGRLMECHRYLIASTDDIVDQCWIKPPKP